MERRFTQTEVRLTKRADDKPLISGYGAVFYDGTDGTQYQLWEGCVERILPVAFDRAIAEKDDVRGLFNHDPNMVLGRAAAGTMRVSIDARGLKYEIDPGETTVSADVQEHLRRGDVTGSSFAFNVTDEDMRQETRDGETLWIREIKGVELLDCGPVTFPAYEGTEANTRSADGAKRSIDDVKNKLASQAAAQRDCVMARARACEIL